jgi:hypothetical protein
MNNLTLVIMSIIVFSFSVLAFKLSFEIHRNVKAGQKFREQLLNRLEQFPIVKMLIKRNINVSEYLHSVPINDIEKQLQNCNKCSAKKECGDVLENVVEIPYSFCPNDEDFKKIKYLENTPH